MTFEKSKYEIQSIKIESLREDLLGLVSHIEQHIDEKNGRIVIGSIDALISMNISLKQTLTPEKALSNILAIYEDMERNDVDKSLLRARWYKHCICHNRKCQPQSGKWCGGDSAGCMSGDLPAPGVLLFESLQIAG